MKKKSSKLQESIAREKAVTRRTTVPAREIEVREWKFAELFEVIKGVVFYYVVYEVEVEGEEKTDEGYLMRATGWLPFVPVRGMELIPMLHDDFRRVDRVYYTPDKPLCVYLERSHIAKSVMESLGWEEVA